MKAQFFFFLAICCFCSSVNAQQNNLDFYIKRAEKNSPLLQQQKNDTKIIALNLQQFNAIYKAPKISVNSSVLLAPILNKDGNKSNFQLLSSGSSNYIGYDLGASNGGQFQALVSVSQPLFTQKNYRAQKEKATILKAKNNQQIKLTKAELKQVVTHQYILCVQAEKLKENSLKTIQIIKAQLQEMKPLVKLGVYKFTDLKLLEIELKSSEIENERLAGEYLSNFNALNLLCGIENAPVISLKNVKLKLAISNQKSLFLRQFKLDSLVINADKKISELNYLPQISAFGDAGLNATYNPSPKRLGFSFGLALKWNLFDGHQKEINTKKSLLQLNTIQTNKAYFKNQNTIRKNNIISQIKNLDQQIVLINNQLQEYKKLLDVYSVEIKQSLISVLELKTIIKEISKRQQVKTNTLMAKQILINMYNYWNL